MEENFRSPSRKVLTLPGNRSLLLVRNAQPACDFMTGLYNRSYFEAQLAALSKTANTLGIIYCDIDLLKFSNDVLGITQGDILIQNAAQVIKSVVPKEMLIARIGGDEFAVLLANVTNDKIEKITSDIRSAVDAQITDEAKHIFSMAVGCSFQCQPAVDGYQLFVEAECDMYHHKVLQSKQVRDRILPWLFKELHLRGISGHGHGRRAQHITHSLGIKLNFTETRLEHLIMAAHFHDIGKIKVPPQILYKPDKLDEHEIHIIRWHSESGYRIALSIPYLAPVADWILKHHERWDGSGYPFGLKGEEIPVESQIIAIADTFDAITNDRSYRLGATAEAAIQEIKKAAGSQFDPHLVELFLEMYHENPDTLLFDKPITQV